MYLRRSGREYVPLSRGSVLVRPGVVTAGINAALSPAPVRGSSAAGSDGATAGGAVSGTVTAAAGGAALAGICVNVFPLAGGNAAQATTAADGNYRVVGLTSSGYAAQFNIGCGNTGNYAPYAYPTTIDVKSGATTKNIDAALTVGGAISGNVTAAATGAPLAGICVIANSDTAPVSSGATTGIDGNYHISDWLPAATASSSSPGAATPATTPRLTTPARSR